MNGNCNCLCGVAQKCSARCDGGADCIVVVDVQDTFLAELTGRPGWTDEPVVMCAPCADAAERRPRTISVIRLNTTEAV